MARHEVDGDAEWKLAAFNAAVQDERVQNLAWSIAEAAQTPEDPKLSAMDVQAARRYLRACILKASTEEVAGMGLHELAALWARGTVGAARYRARRPAPAPSPGNQRSSRRTR